MTEAEWLALDSIEHVSPLSILRGSPNERRMFLFLDAYLPRLLFDQFCPTCRQDLPLFPRQGEGELTVDAWRTPFGRQHEMSCGTRNAIRAARNFMLGIICPAEFWSQLFATHHEVSVELVQSRMGESGIREWAKRHYAEVAQVQREGVWLLKDIAGNPLRQVAFSPSWRTSTAVALASQMYESRDFGAMPILADALQDAGCDSADVLDHCHSSGPHVRGCWVVDLVLGKE